MNLGRASHETVCRRNTEAMKNDRLILVDSDAYTSSVLVDGLLERGFGTVQSVASTLELPKVLETNPPDVVIFNYHSDQPDSLIVCSTIKFMVPTAATIVMEP